MKYSAPTKRTNILFDTENIKRCVLISVWVNYGVYFLQEKCLGANGGLRGAMGYCDSYSLTPCVRP